MEIYTKDCSPTELYKLMSGTVVPRPIALVSTKCAEGIYNVAPFSFFNVIHPPMVMFSVGNRKGNRKKDTVLNIEQHSEFVINLVNAEMAQQVHNAGSEYLPEISEFEEVGFTPATAKVIDGIAVKEAPIKMECKLDRIIQVKDSNMVLAEVVHFDIDDTIYQGNFKIDFEKLNPVGRLAGNMYTNIKPYSLKRTYNPDKVLKS